METPPPISLPPHSQPGSPSRGNEKIWSIFCHLSVFIGIGFLLVPIVVYLAMKDESEYVAANAREALNFHISVLIYLICCIPLYFILIGAFLAVVITFAMFILSVVAAIKASEGGCYRYPLTIRLVP
jgi:uncharacterized Tic20 family protein